METKYENKQGFCPKCGSYNLDYEVMELQDDMMCYYPYKCEECGLQGGEWYKMEFAGHNIYDENGELIEL